MYYMMPMWSFILFKYFWKPITTTTAIPHIADQPFGFCLVNAEKHIDTIKINTIIHNPAQSAIVALTGPHINQTSVQGIIRSFSMPQNSYVAIQTCLIWAVGWEC